MHIVYALLTVLSTATTTTLLVRLLYLRCGVEWWLGFYVVGSGTILGIGYTLSALTLFGQVWAWAVLSLIVLGSVGATTWFISKRGSPQPHGFTFQRGLPSLAIAMPTLTRRQWLILAIPALAFSVTLLLNGFIVLWLSPHEWDSMAYHLARLAYYLQHNHLGYFDANYWAQVVHPKNATILMAYVFLVSDRHENLTQANQFVAYLAAGLAVYGIARRLKHTKPASVFAALLFTLLIECLMQATTTQNDMVIAAMFGVGVYCLLSYRDDPRQTYLVLAAMSIGIALGVKASALLVLPSLALIAWYGLRMFGGERRNAMRRLGTLVALTGLGIGIFALPAGYVENYRVFGHPLGPESVRAEHSFGGVPVSLALLNGSKNVVRYSLEFLSLDGLKGTRITALQTTVRDAVALPIRWSGIDLEAQDGVRAQFTYAKRPAAHESFSYWGVLGFALLIPMGLFAVFYRPTSGERVVIGAAFVFLLAQAYAGPYDPWRGRYFIPAAILISPVAARWLDYARHRVVAVYLICVLSIGGWSAVSAIVYRDNRALLPYRYDTGDAIVDIPSILASNRLEQLGTLRFGLAEILKNYERLVPPDAVVAVDVGPGFFEYPLFGVGLTRTLLPVHSFWRGPQPIPAAAEYLIFSSITQQPEQGDVLLGKDTYEGEVYLRRLSSVASSR